MIINDIDGLGGTVMHKIPPQTIKEGLDTSRAG